MTENSCTGIGFSTLDRDASRLRGGPAGRQTGVRTLPGGAPADVGAGDGSHDHAVAARARAAAARLQGQAAGRARVPPGRDMPRRSGPNARLEVCVVTTIFDI